MRSDLDFANSKLLAPVVFRDEFNKFEQINAGQAWSLFFSGGKEDKIFGKNPELGNFFTYTLVAFAAVAILWACTFSPIV